MLKLTCLIVYVVCFAFRDRAKLARIQNGNQLCFFVSAMFGACQDPEAKGIWPVLGHQEFFASLKTTFGDFGGSGFLFPECLWLMIEAARRSRFVHN